MPNNQFSIWSEVYDLRDERDQKKFELSDHDIDVIQRLVRGESAGIKLHKLKGTTPPVYSAYVNDTRRLLFISHESTLALIGILPKHNYQDLQAGFAEKFYRKAAAELGLGEFETEEVADIDHLKHIKDYVYQTAGTCTSYHQKFITLDDEQTGALTVPTPAVIIGDPGSGKSSICSVMMENDINNPALLDDDGLIAYFSESSGLAKKMRKAWRLDHPVTARRPEANQLAFLNYEKLLATFGPRALAGKTAVGAQACQLSVAERLSNKAIQKQAPFVNDKAFKDLMPTIYHEFQIIAVCGDQAVYCSKQQKTNFPMEWREFIYQLYQHYQGVLNQKKQYDPNLLLWQPEAEPFSRLYHDESLSASPAMNLMLRRLTRDANIVFFADPNQENTKQISDLSYIIGELGVNAKPTTVVNLKKTYRLPRVVAELANELLVIKQNLNGGKNEKNQSNQIIYHDPEGRHPGFLSWHGLEGVAALADRLNKSNQVYVVITHAEYQEEAKQHFGDKTLIFTIEEARGQEFEMVVLYRVTDPHPKGSPGRAKKKEKSVLTQVNEVLSTLGAELQTKPNLAKRGKGNRSFEPYMNSLYIAVSRIAHQGYIVEGGELSKNQLHQRLVASINKSMANVALSEALPMMTVEAVLTRARNDLAEGHLLQAEAGFLRAGLSREDFCRELAEKNHREAALLNQIEEERKERSLQAGKLSPSDMKLLDALIKNDDSESFKGMLASFHRPDQLLMLPYDKNQTVLAAALAKKKLRGAVVKWLLDQPGSHAAIFKAINFSALVVMREGKKGLKLPLIYALATTEDGRRLLDVLAAEGEPGLFAGLSSAVLLGQLSKGAGSANQSLMEAAITPTSWLFVRLYEDNLETFQNTSDGFWFNPLPSRQHECLLAHFCRQIEVMEGALQERSVALFESIISRLLEGPKPLILKLFNSDAREPVFDLILQSGKYPDLLNSILLKGKGEFANTYFLEEISYKESSVPRLEIILESEITKSIGLRLLTDIIVDHPDKTMLDRFYKQFMSDDARIKMKETQLCDRIDHGEWTKDDIFDLFEDEEKVSYLMKPIDLPDGSQLCNLMMLLRNVSALDALRVLLETIPEDGAHRHFIRNYKSAIGAMGVDHCVKVVDKEGEIHTVPTWHTLVDHHGDLIVVGIHAVNFSGEMDLQSTSKMTTSYYADRSKININLLTLCCIASVNFMCDMLTVHPKCVQWIEWNVIYPHSNGYLLNVLATHGASEFEEDKEKDDYNKARRNIVKLLKSFDLKPEAYLDPDVLFRPGYMGIDNRYIFDSFFVSHEGIALFSLYNEALIASQAFRSYFNDEFLMATFMGSNDPGSMGKTRDNSFTRFSWLAFLPALEPLLRHFLRQVDEIERWVSLMTTITDADYDHIEDYQWSAFANLIMSDGHRETLRMLINERPDALKNLPSWVWHAPVKVGDDNNLPVDNYLLLKLIIRVHGKGFIGQFFKDNYQEEYNKAENHAGNVILSTQERMRQNEANLAKILAIPMIKNDSDTLLKSILQDKSQFPNLMAVHDEKTVIDHIMCSDKLRGVIIQTLNDWVDSQSAHKIKALFSAIDMNASTVGDGALVRPLWHHVIDTTFGFKLLAMICNDDAEFVIRRMSVNTLTWLFKGATDSDESGVPLVLSLICYVPIFAFAWLRFSESRDQVLSKAISSPHCPDYLRGYGLIQNFANKVFLDLAPGPEYDLSVHTVALLLESASTVFKLKKLDIPKIFGASTHDTLFYAALKTKVNPGIVSMFISAIREINSTYADQLVKRYGFSEDNFDKVNHKRGREISKNGLTTEARRSYEAMVASRNMVEFKALLKDRLFSLLLFQKMDDGRRLYLHLYEVDEFRAELVKQIMANVMEANEGRLNIFDVQLPFSSSIYLEKININGHEMPLFFDMMQDVDTQEMVRLFNVPFDYMTTPYYSRSNRAMLSTLFIYFTKLDLRLNQVVVSDQGTYKRMIGHPDIIKAYDIQREILSALICLLHSPNRDENQARYLNDIMFHDGSRLLKEKGYAGLFERLYFSDRILGESFSHFDLLVSNIENRLLYLDLVKANTLPIEPLIMQLSLKSKTPALILLLKDEAFATELKLYRGDPQWSRWESREVVAALYRSLMETMWGEVSAFKTLLDSAVGRKAILKLLKLVPELFDFIFPPELGLGQLNQLDQMINAYMQHRISDYDEFKSVAAYRVHVSQYIETMEEVHDDNLAYLLSKELGVVDLPDRNLSPENEIAAWHRLFARVDAIEQLVQLTASKQTLFMLVLGKPQFRYAFTIYLASLTSDQAVTTLANLIEVHGLEHVVHFESGSYRPFISVLLDCAGSENLVHAAFMTSTNRYYAQSNSELSTWVEPTLRFKRDGDEVKLSLLDVLLLDHRLHAIAKRVIDKRLNEFMALCSVSQGGPYLFGEFKTFSGEQTRAAILISVATFHFYLLMLLKQNRLSIVDFASFLNRQYQSAMLAGSVCTLVQMLHASPTGRQVIDYILNQPPMVERLDEPLLDALKRAIAAPEASVVRYGMFQAESVRAEAKGSEPGIKPKK